MSPRTPDEPTVVTMPPEWNAPQTEPVIDITAIRKPTPQEKREKLMHEDPNDAPDPMGLFPRAYIRAHILEQYFDADDEGNLDAALYDELNRRSGGTDMRSLRVGGVLHYSLSADDLGDLVDNVVTDLDADEAFEWHKYRFDENGDVSAFSHDDGDTWQMMPKPKV